MLLKWLLLPTAYAFSASSALTADTPAVLPDFTSREEYMDYLKSVSALPQGFATGCASGKFVSYEAPSMGELPIRATVIALDQPSTSWAAVFTSNRFPGAPVTVGRSLLGKPLRAIVINNKVSNVCSGSDGVADANAVCEAVAKNLDITDGAVLPSSTGVIGWRLPVDSLVERVVPAAITNLQKSSILQAAEFICTTDRYPKIRSKTLSNGARVIGIAKGAGMIEPNMATMLCYILTDAVVPASIDLQSLLKTSVDQSFNSISIDGDESTSDTAVLVSSALVENTNDEEFTMAIQDICQGLAADLVRNGEGTAHVMRVQITGYPGNAAEARRLGRHVVNSPLLKCAIAGNDPNTGRLAGAVGSFLGKWNPTAQLDTLKLGGRTIFKAGKFVLEGQEVENELSDIMKFASFDETSDYPVHQRFVDFEINFTGGDASATVIGSDLTAEYVAVNADYRS